MTIDVICPGGHKMKVAEKYAGKKIRCPKCSQETVVPPLTDDSTDPGESLASEAGLPVKKTPVKVEQKPTKGKQDEDFPDLDEMEDDFAGDALEPEDDDFAPLPTRPSKQKKAKVKKKVIKESKPAKSQGAFWIIGGIGAGLIALVAIVVVMIVLNRQGSEIVKTSPQPSIVAGSSGTAEPAVVPTTEAPKNKARARVSIPMPASVKQLVVGGSGSYLVAAMPAEGQISIVDVRSRTIGNPISVDDTDFVIAAGESKFVVVKQTKNQIARYDLSTGVLEHSTSINPVKAIAMGCSSEGPVLGIDRQTNDAFMLELGDLKPMPGEIRNPSAAHQHLCAASSADGTIFSIWDDLSNPCGVNTIKRTGAETWVSNSVHAGTGSSIPSADGQFIITSHERFDDSGKQMSGDSNSSKIRTAVPSATGPVYVDFNAPFMRDAQRDAIDEIQLRSQYDDTVLAIINDITFPGIKDPVTKINLPLSQRLYLLPDVNSLVTTTHLANELVIHDFNLKEELLKSDQNFMLIASSPPLRFRRGENLTYQVKVFSKGNDIGYSVENGPPGFEISSNGLASWQVPADFPLTPTAVKIVVKEESGMKVSHSFTLQPPYRERFDVPLPGQAKSVAVAGSGSHLIVALPDQKQVAVVNVEEKKIETIIPIDDSDIAVAGGESKFVILQRTQGTISRFDLATLERELTTACEPFKAIAMGVSSEGPILAAGQDVVALNLQSLKALPGTISVYRELQEGTPNLRAAANGRVFTAWCNDKRGAYRIEALGGLWDAAFQVDSRYSVFPSADGQVTYTCFGRLDPKLKSAEKQRKYCGIVIPAVTAPFNVLLEDPGNLDHQRLKVSKISIRSQHDDSLVVSPQGITLPKMPPPIPGRPGNEAPNTLALWDRLIWLDSLDTLITIPDTYDRLFFYDFDLQEELNNSVSNYFFVSSVPPKYYKAGEQFSYQIEVMSKNKDLEFRLENGPTGMAVSPTGLVTWQAPGVASKEDIIATVRVRDSTGKELGHTIRMSFGSEAQAIAKKKQEMKKSKTPNQGAVPGMRKR